MADFQTSTHRARWIFTPLELAEKYQTANERAKKALEKNGIKQSEERPQAHKTHDDIKGIRHSRSKPLNLEEEKLMRIFYEHKIQEVCAAFKFPHKIQATAIIYFKRFYLQWSVMEHHPKHIMLTCIYASCKIEENHVSAEELGKGIEQDHQVILDNEMTVFQGLDFELIVYAPYRSIEGFVYDMEDFVRENSGQLNNFEELRDTAMKEADMIMLTDAPLLFTPGQLAMAALHKSNYMHGVLDFGRYLDNVICHRNFPQSASELMETISSINSLTSKLQIPTAHDMKHIDRKLKSCLDPSSIDEKKREKRSKHKSRKISGDAPVAHVNPKYGYLN